MDLIEFVTQMLPFIVMGAFAALAGILVMVISKLSTKQFGDDFNALWSYTKYVSYWMYALAAIFIIIGLFVVLT